MFMKILTLGRLVLLCCGLATIAGHGAIIVAPNAQTEVYGNSGDSIPFWIPWDRPGDSARFQQVYAASEFSNFPTAGGVITGIAFRANEPFFGYTLSNIQVSFSTTLKSPDSLSPVFSENVGLDDLIVLGPGALNIPGAFPSSPTYWDVVVPLASPFYYQPSNGNLLMDVRNYGGRSEFSATIASFDGQFTMGDSVSSVYASARTGGGVGSLSGEVWTFGFVTRFEFIPIPEPSSALLLCMAGTLLVFVRCRKGRN